MENGNSFISPCSHRERTAASNCAANENAARGSDPASTHNAKGNLAMRYQLTPFTAVPGRRMACRRGLSKITMEKTRGARSGA